MLDSYMDMSSKIAPGQEMPFPKESARNMVRNKLINKATNLKSVAYDNMFGDTSFYEDIQKGFINEKYSNLGIEDPTGGDITPEDAEIMARTLINDSKYEAAFKNELTNYYTRFLEQNWKDGEAFQAKAKKGYRFTGSQYVQEDVLSDPNELSGNEDKTKTGGDGGDPPSSPYPNMNMDLVKSVQAGDAKFPTINPQDQQGGVKEGARKLNNILSEYGFSVEKTGGWLSNRVLIKHANGNEREFKISSGNIHNRARHVEAINNWVQEQSQNPVNWDEYNKTYGLETQE